MTVTHPDITRYFMMIPEAARLVEQAAAIGESGQVLVLDMGEPVRILDLAIAMIRLSGKAVQQIHIEFSGLRPGEKPYEELLAGKDVTLSTPFESLRIAKLYDVNRARQVLNLVTVSATAEHCGDEEMRDALRGLLHCEYLV